MIPISTNTTNTVGLVDSPNPKSDFIGEFNPVLLKQWADVLMEHMGEADVVYLAIHKNADPMETARCLAASVDYGDEIQVMVCGCDCDDVVKKGGEE